MWFAAGLVASCTAPPGDVAESGIGRGNVLWLPAGAEIMPDVLRPISAENGRSLYADGSAAMSFTVTGDRDDVAAGLVHHFTTAGWSQRTTQYLNPKLLTSFNDGWQRRCGCVVATDPQGNPVAREPFYEWHGEWEDSRGNIVTYSLAAEGRRLRGYGAYIPKRLVDAAPRPQ